MGLINSLLLHVNAGFSLKGEKSKISSINDFNPKVRSTLFEICSPFIQHFKHPCGHPFQSWSFFANDDACDKDPKDTVRLHSVDLV